MFSFEKKELNTFFNKITFFSLISIFLIAIYAFFK